MSDLAVDRAILRLRGVIDLEVEISGKYYTVSFHVADKQRQQVFTTAEICLTHYFANAAADTFRKLVKRHAPIFHQSGRLHQALT